MVDMAEKKVKYPLAEPPADDEFELFDAEEHKAPKYKQENDAEFRHLGQQKIFKSGLDKLREASKKRGLNDLPLYVRVAFRRSTQELAIIPLKGVDPKGRKVHYGPKQSSARIYLREAFLYYQIDMLKDTIWQLDGTVEELPKLGWCLAFDLRDVIRSTEERKRIAASRQA